jgi:hypothetical protein
VDRLQQFGPCTANSHSEAHFQVNNQNELRHVHLVRSIRTQREKLKPKLIQKEYTMAKAAAKKKAPAKKAAKKVAKKAKKR